MAMAYTLPEFQQAKFFICLSVANKLRLSNPEFESSETLQRWISASNPELGAVLSKFLSAYDRWYQFHLNIDVSEDGRVTSPAEATQHVALVEARDARRAALLEALKKVAIP